jgi:DNA polymerase-1
MASMASALPAPGSDDVLWLVDLSNYVFRAYHGMPPLHGPSGEPTNATLGTLNMLGRLVQDQRPRYLGVAMDTPGRGFRGELSPSYKATRPPAPPDLVVQLGRCREIFEAYRVPVMAVEGFEADDVIATLTGEAVSAGLRVVIASSDKDLMQLVDGERVLVWDPMHGKVFGPAEVRAKLGVEPGRVRELLALAGDSSDNIAGVPGVGLKTAAQLLAEFPSLAALRARLDEVKRPKLRQALGEHFDAALLAHRLVELRRDTGVRLDLAALRYGDPDLPRLRRIFTELGFARLLATLDPVATASTSPVAHASSGPTTILDRDALGALAEAARARGRLALMAFGLSDDPLRTPLTGLGLCAAAGEARYLPLGHRYLTAPAQLPLAAVRELLGPVLGDAKVAKLGHDLKHTAVVLARHDLPLAGAHFDSLLASYLLDVEASHKLALLAERHASMSWAELATKPARGRGGPSLTVEETDVDVMAGYAAAQVEAVARLVAPLRRELETAGLAPLYDEAEIPLIGVLARMEQHGVQISTEPLALLGEEMRRELAAIERRAHEAAGRELNLASPRQLETVLFDELGLPVTRKTKTGRSTDHDALAAIAERHPLPRLVLEHRALAKLLGTYVEALPLLVHPETGRIHTRWEQAVTATGRLSSKDPNLQNIPVRTAHGKRIREAFTAPPGMVIMSADYSQIELRVLAHLSRDPKLVEAFSRGQDVHVRTAMEVFGVPETEVTPAMRAQSKTVNFGVIYGMGPVALAQHLDISNAEAKRFIDAYFERYQGVRDFMERCLAEARETGRARTLLGRRRMLPDLRSGNRVKRAYAERIAQNTPIQGTAADLLKLAMVRLGEPVVPGARMILTVHDELVFEVPAGLVEPASRTIRAAMESVHPLAVPLVVDIGWGASWAAAH